MKKDPTKTSAFQKVIGVFLSTPPKTHSDQTKKAKSRANRKKKKK